MATDEASARVERERQWHDERFSENSGELATSKFYSVTVGIGEFYDSRVGQIQPGERVLELGTGLTASTWSLAARKVHVVGIDISGVAVDEMQSLAVEKGVTDYATFETMNAEDLTFPDESFDLVIGNGILHHLDLDKALTGINRVLAPGGRCVFREPMGHNPVINAYRKRTPELRTEDEHPLVMSDLELIDARFPGLDAQFFNLVDLASLAALKTSRFETVRSALAKVDQQLFAKVPAVRRYGWMVGLSFHKAGVKPS